MNLRRAICIVVLSLPLTSRLSAQQPLRGFDAYATRALQDWGVPGLAISVVKDDSVVYARGFGVRRLGDTAAVTPRTLFAIGSCTKAMTAAALGLLVDSGKLRWDDPATQYLTGFQLYDPFVTRELTVRDLLTHRSGLARGDALWWATAYDRAEVLRRIRYLKPSSSFRSTYGYQNIMYLAAGQLIPAVAGQSWEDFLRERLFGPLGMTATVTSVTQLPANGDIASPHDRLDGRLQPIAWRNIDNIAPAGSVSSSVLEMAQWVRLQLGNGTYRGRRLVSPDRIKEMHAPQTIIPIDTVTERLRPSTHFQAYGLGWTLSDYRGRKLVSHSGAIDGFRAIVLLALEERLGIVVLANGGEAGRLLTSALAMRVVDAYLGGALRDWSKDLLEVRRNQVARAQADERRRDSLHVSGTMPSLQLSSYAGTYTNQMYGDARVTLENGSLVLRWAPAFTAQVGHWHYDTFLARWEDRTMSDDLVTFALNAEGKVDHFTWPGVGEFTRKPEPAAATAGSQ